MQSVKVIEAIIADKQRVYALLVQARREIVQRGHCRGQGMDAEGRVCAFGAIDVAPKALKWKHPDAFIKTDALVTLSKACNGRGIIHYNDRITSTTQEILDWFDRAIVIVDAEITQLLNALREARDADEGLGPVVEVAVGDAR